jgi:alkanesulfonate monooxygenase SsuD/methylene tetrahydromethanopterin reductase-like flavin-dependent oxidoreductase (luciferase family)
MSASSKLLFGYNPPAAERGLEPVNPRTFTKDLQGVLDVMVPNVQSIWLGDHLMNAERFRLEAWTVLTWIAARYPTPMLGTFVLAQSFRYPPLLAKMVATLQFMSEGRYIFGYGAGWDKPEYDAYGYPFPSARKRIEELDDAIRVMKALWTESPATYKGTHYEVKDAYCEPRPDPIPPLMLGGDGEKYMLRVVAEHADWWLSLFRRPEVLEHKLAVLAQHCQDVGRDVSEIKKCVPIRVFLDRDGAAAKHRAGKNLEKEHPDFAGDPAELRDYIAQLQAAGFDKVLFLMAGFPDTADLKLLVDEVLPHFA